MKVILSVVVNISIINGWTESIYEELFLEIIWQKHALD